MPVLISMVEQLQYLPWRENGTKILDTTTKALKQVGIELKLNLSSDLNFRELFIKQRINPGTTLKKRLGMDCKSLRLWCTNCSGKNGSESKTENFQVLVHAARKPDKNKPREGLPWLFSVSLSLILSVWHSVHCAPTEDVPPAPCIQIWLKTVTAVRGTRCWWGWACTNRADTVPAKPPAESWGDAGSHCSYHLLEMGVSGGCWQPIWIVCKHFFTAGACDFAMHEHISVQPRPTPPSYFSAPSYLRVRPNKCVWRL